MKNKRKFIDKVLDALGFETQAEDEVDSIQEEINGNKRPNIIGLPATSQLKVLILEPTMFEEVQKVSDHLKGRRQVIANLDRVDKETAQRIVDFLSGVTYALNGSMQKVGNNIFLFTPSNVLISNETKIEGGKVVNINWDKSSKED